MTVPVSSLGCPDLVVIALTCPAFAATVSEAQSSYLKAKKSSVIFSTVCSRPVFQDLPCESCCTLAICHQAPGKGKSRRIQCELLLTWRRLVQRRLHFSSTHGIPCWGTRNCSVKMIDSCGHFKSVQLKRRNSRGMWQPERNTSILEVGFSRKSFCGSSW